MILLILQGVDFASNMMFSAEAAYEIGAGDR